MMIRENIKEKFYDCHIHIPMQSINPVETLLKEINDNDVDGFVLILNSAREEDMYLDHLEFLNGHNYKIALLLDIRSRNGIENFDKLKKEGIEYIVKIHPRINCITKDDFKLVKEQLGYLSYRTIIVDNWFFGCQIDNHIGTELAIYLAEELHEKSVVIAHAGGCKIVESMLLTRPLKNIYYDLSLTQLYFKGASLDLDIDYFVKWTSDRVLFGSDYPDFSISDSWLSFRQHYRNIGMMDKLYDSSELARKIYGLK